jgi:hypothetical protein
MTRRTIKLKPGQRMRKGRRWHLEKGTRRFNGTFNGTLLETINIGSKRLALFSVPKRFGM